jgi:NAD(P)-dependent dehydrogenase (short-subunit alcohol dehydrogenase family)
VTGLQASYSPSISFKKIHPKMAPMNLQSTQDHGELFSAKGLTCVVTGGGTGIGLAIANALVQTGAEKVYILGRRVSVLEEAAKSLNGDSKVVAVPVECDVGNLDSIKAAVGQIEKESDHVDVLVNNAGVSGPDHKDIYQAKTISELQDVLLRTPEAWAPTFAINSTAVMLVSAAFLHLLDQGNRKRGVKPPKETDDKLVLPTGSNDKRTSQIITVSSIASFNRHITAGTAYCGSKAAATAISKSMASFLAPWGIRSNVICPGCKCFLSKSLY